MRISPEMKKILEDGYNAPAVSTGRLVVCLPSPAGAGQVVPVFIVNGTRGDSSPYNLEESAPGNLHLVVDGQHYTDITMFSRPAFYDLTTSGNMPMSKIAVVVGPGHLRAVVSQNCYYAQIGQPCKFCAVQHWWNSAAAKQPLQIAEAVEAAVKEGVAKHISITTATLNTPDKGLKQLVETSGLVHERTDIPIMLEFEPVSDPGLLRSLLEQGREYGVTTVSLNIECFDENLREVIMPAKGKIPVREYFDNWEVCLDIFGKNEVSTTIVAGIGESDESILKGIEATASSGVMNFLVPHSPAAGAEYADFTPPTAERMLHLYDKASEIHRKYNLDLYACTAGCVKGGGFSGIKEVARFGV